MLGSPNPNLVDKDLYVSPVEMSHRKHNILETKSLRLLQYGATTSVNISKESLDRRKWR